MHPAEAAARARALVAGWIAAAPRLADVLAWHEALCLVCGPARKCAEHSEITAEYGAGPYGISEFYPDR